MHRVNVSFVIESVHGASEIFSQCLVNNKCIPIATFLSFFNLIIKCMLTLQGPVRQDGIYHCAHRGALVINGRQTVYITGYYANLTRSF